MKQHIPAATLGCLIVATLCAPASADGFKFPTIPNPFKKSPAADRAEPPVRATLSDQPAEDRPSSFSLPKPKLPKFDLPNLGGDEDGSATTERSATGSRSRTAQTSPQRRSSRSSASSVLGRFSRGTKSFFGKAKSTLMPWANETASVPVAPGPPSGSGSRHAARTNRSRSSTPVREASASNGFSFPWSKSKPDAEEKKEINSASDFLRLDRPRYY